MAARSDLRSDDHQSPFAKTVSIMIYSRWLYTEHEQPHHDDGEGAYTIFSTQQLFVADCMALDVV